MPPEPRCIPEVIHRIWVGSEPPDWVQATEAAWQRALGVGWDLWTWTDADIGVLPISRRLAADVPHPVVLADIARAEILHRHGGIYLDCDLWPVREPTWLAGRRPPWVTREHARPGIWSVCNAAIGLPVGHRLAELVLEHAATALYSSDRWSVDGSSIPWANIAAPPVWTEYATHTHDVDVLAPATFYPLPWHRRHEVPALLADADAAERWPYTYGVHEWAGSWRVSAEAVAVAE